MILPAAPRIHGSEDMTPPDCMRIQLDDELALAWEDWLDVNRYRYHIGYELVGNSLEEHTAACLASARSTVDRLFDEYGDIRPKRILDVGCSTGFKSLALNYRFPEAAVHGIDPDDVAVSLGQTLISKLSGHERSGCPSLSVGYAERLPYPNSHFDAIVCVTVLEHVSDVRATMVEMARVLRPGGLLFLEAPNYLWPYEPHLRIVVPPLCPKPLMRALAHLQGAGSKAGYVAHLKLVHPFWIERMMRDLGLTWENRVVNKLDAVFAGHLDTVLQYHRAAGALRAIERMGLARALGWVILGLRMYPSMIYVARRP